MPLACGGSWRNRPLYFLLHGVFYISKKPVRRTASFSAGLFSCCKFFDSVSIPDIFDIFMGRRLINIEFRANAIRNFQRLFQRFG